MNQITRKAALLCPPALAGALLVAGLSTGCGGRLPPCNPEGEGNGGSLCLDSRREQGGHGPCANLQLVFQSFCRDWAKDQACWSASNEGNAGCLAKG